MASKITITKLVEELAEHTGVEADSVKDVIYGFLHYIVYVKLATGQNINIRNFGNVKLRKMNSRSCGNPTGGTISLPARMKVFITSGYMEVPRWRNMLSILNHSTFAPDAEQRQNNMDLSVFARIADLVLSNPQIDQLVGQQKVSFLRKWTESLGTNPSTNPVTADRDYDGRLFNVIRTRLAGMAVKIGAFDFVPESLFLGAEFGTFGCRSVIFLPNGWLDMNDVRRLAYSNTDPTVVLRPYGKSSEEQVSSLYSAYKVLKYGR